MWIFLPLYSVFSTRSACRSSFCKFKLARTHTHTKKLFRRWMICKIIQLSLSAVGLHIHTLHLVLFCVRTACCSSEQVKTNAETFFSPVFFFFFFLSRCHLPQVAFNRLNPRGDPGSFSDKNRIRSDQFCRLRGIACRFRQTHAERSLFETPESFSLLFFPRLLTVSSQQQTCGNQFGKSISAAAPPTKKREKEKKKEAIG